MKNFFKIFGIIALVAVIGFALAGCEDPNSTDPAPGKREPKTGTIKLTPTGTNTFTLTLTGYVFTENASQNFGPDVIPQLELDGPVTAEGVDAGGKHRAIDEPYDIDYSYVRTSDTEYAVTMSQRRFDNESDRYAYFGSGKLKFKNDAYDIGDTKYHLGGMLVDYQYWDGEGGDDSFSIAADSGSVSFNFPKYVWE